MEEYYFLFAVALLWTLFAVVQDLRKREVANWLNFSLIAIALGYRGFYAAYTGNLWFFLFGLIGFGLFFVLAMGFYYSKVFAGGDAKLLMGLGAVLPFTSFRGLLIGGIGFILALFLIGAIYSLIYSVPLAYINRKKFASEFYRKLRDSKIIIAVSLILILILILTTAFQGYIIALVLLLLMVPFLYAYVMSLQKCMQRFVFPESLTEGDWIVSDVKVGSKIIKKTVHGLSIKDIEILRKAKKKVLIEEGIPFTPAFLLALLFMVFAYLFLLHSEIFASLF